MTGPKRSLELACRHRDRAQRIAQVVTQNADELLLESRLLPERFLENFTASDVAMDRKQNEAQREQAEARARIDPCRAVEAATHGGGSLFQLCVLLGAHLGDYTSSIVHERLALVAANDRERRQRLPLLSEIDARANLVHFPQNE